MEVVPEAGAALGRVECVAPLLRGLKLAGDAGGPAVPGEVECVAPLLRGLKPEHARCTSATVYSVECVAPPLRGLKHIDALDPREGAVVTVECVAPLLRGLKRGKKSSSNILRDSSSNALPRY